jgi:hypothetical protein
LLGRLVCRSASFTSERTTRAAEPRSDPPSHLSLVDKIAVCSAGHAAERVFGVESHERASFKDHREIARVLEEHGVSEEERGPMLRDEGHDRACALLLQYKDEVIRLADLLVKQGSVSKESFDRLMRRDEEELKD